MQGSEYGNRGDGGAGEIRGDVLRDAGKAEDVDVQHLTGSLRRLEIRARVVPEAEIKAFAGGGLLDHVGVAFELIADCRAVYGCSSVMVNRMIGRFNGIGIRGYEALATSTTAVWTQSCRPKASPRLRSNLFSAGRRPPASLGGRIVAVR
jgi:hypothetical protein